MSVAGNNRPDRSPHQILGVSRRALLRAAGVGAAATAVPWAAAGTASATPAAIPPPEGLPLVGGPEFPIGIFWPPHPYASTPARFQEIRDAGFTFVISGNYAADGNIFARQLGLARDAGLAMLISDDIQIRNMSRWFGISDNPADFMTISTAEARELYTRARNAYGPYSSLAGFNLYDEPGPGWFSSLARAVAVAREQAPGLLPYVNLYPSLDPTYYQRFVDQVRPSLVSFDRYPLLSGGREDADYFYNWAIVRQAAQSADLPIWIFIQTLAYNNHREPTAAELAWQVNVSLAYGAKGVQYFTYWTPDVARGEGFGPALITVDGKRTPRYHAARRINTTWLRQAGGQLKPLVPESVVHAGEDPLPRGAVGFTPTDRVRAVEGGPFVIGTFRDRDATDTRWLLVANRLHSAAVTGRLHVDPSTVEAIEVFDPATETYRPAPHPDRLHLALRPGGATLLRLRGRQEPVR
jgi:hypothetical protein